MLAACWRSRHVEKGALNAVADSRGQHPNRGERGDRETWLLVEWGVAPRSDGGPVAFAWVAGAGGRSCIVS
jgi:hypothetical protein